MSTRPRLRDPGRARHLGPRNIHVSPRRRRRDPSISEVYHRDTSPLDFTATWALRALPAATRPP